VPVVVFGIGEGGSGGALAIGFGDRLVMLENAYYSVVSPEGCATILHKDANRAEDVAAGLRMNASDLVDLGIADEIVIEPPGGAQRDPAVVYAGVSEALAHALAELCPRDPERLVADRYERLRRLGVFEEPTMEVTT